MRNLIEFCAMCVTYTRRFSSNLCSFSFSFIWSYASLLPYSPRKKSEFGLGMMTILFFFSVRLLCPVSVSTSVFLCHYYQWDVYLLSSDFVFHFVCIVVSCPNRNRCVLERERDSKNSVNGMKWKWMTYVMCACVLVPVW